MSEVKIFKVGEYYFVAAANAEEAFEFLKGKGHVCEDENVVKELSDEDLEEHTFHDQLPEYDDDGEEINDNNTRSFKDQLENLILSGQQFPCVFAITED